MAVSLGMGEVMAEFSYYNLRALRDQPRIRENWAESLILILQRISVIERILGQPVSQWYGTDPVTGTYYGPPAESNFAHDRITTEGAPDQWYLRDRIDQLREIGGAPPFPWRYTPSLEEYTNKSRKVGLDARQLLEMLQAIGRVLYTQPIGSMLRHTIDYVKNYDGTESYDVSPLSAFSYHRNTQFSIDRVIDYESNDSYGSKSGGAVYHRNGIDYSGWKPRRIYDYNRTVYVPGYTEINEPEIIDRDRHMLSADVFVFGEGEEVVEEFDRIETEGRQFVLLIDLGPMVGLKKIRSSDYSASRYFSSGSQPVRLAYSEQHMHSGMDIPPTYISESWAWDNPPPYYAEQDPAEPLEYEIIESNSLPATYAEFMGSGRAIPTQSDRVQKYSWIRPVTAVAGYSDRVDPKPEAAQYFSNLNGVWDEYRSRYASAIYDSEGQPSKMYEDYYSWDPHKNPPTLSIGVFGASIEYSGSLRYAGILNGAINFSIDDYIGKNLSMTWLLWSDPYVPINWPDTLKS